MKDCSICKYCDEDFIFDEETGMLDVFREIIKKDRK